MEIQENNVSLDIIPVRKNTLFFHSSFLLLSVIPDHKLSGNFPQAILGHLVDVLQFRKLNSDAICLKTALDPTVFRAQSTQDCSTSYRVKFRLLPGLLTS